jgi:hypothetical protein
MFKTHPTLFIKMMVGIVGTMLVLSPLPARSAGQPSPTITVDTACRFGVNAPLSPTGFDIASLKVASLLDWGANNNPSLPAGVEYIRVLRLRDDLYPATLASLPAWVQANPGSVWIVGNEPDTTYEDQDALLPEVYADRFFELAKIIRRLDRTAQITFGTVVQPTPIRIRYLQRAWDRLAQDAGSLTAASALVDIWTPHSFILNEQLGGWGTGIPPGFEDDHDDAIIITDFADTYSNEIFQQRIFNFRAWMKTIGERNKPLWITEYGSLFPPIDPPGSDYYNVSDEDTSTFMWGTFNFLLLSSDNQTGMPADNNQLVQRWFWYSLNDHRYHFGGSLYNPDYPEYGELITFVGENFLAYQSSHLTAPDLLPTALTITPLTYNDDRTLVNYLLTVTIDNLQFYDASCGQLSVYDGDPQAGGTLIVGPLLSSAFHPNDGTALVPTLWSGVTPLTSYTLYACVDSIAIADTDPSNDCAPFTVYATLPHLTVLPLAVK